MMKYSLSIPENTQLIGRRALWHCPLHKDALTMAHFRETNNTIWDHYSSTPTTQNLAMQLACRTTLDPFAVPFCYWQGATEPQNHTNKALCRGLSVNTTAQFAAQGVLPHLDSTSWESTLTDSPQQVEWRHFSKPVRHSLALDGVWVLEIGTEPTRYATAIQGIKRAAITIMCN